MVERIRPEFDTGQVSVEDSYSREERLEPAVQLLLELHKLIDSFPAKCNELLKDHRYIFSAFLVQ